MKPNLSRRTLIRAKAGIAWSATLKHRIYSCPDTSTYDYLTGATALKLIHGGSHFCVPLEVCAVVRLEAAQLDNPGNLPAPYADRIAGYLEEVRHNGRIIKPNVAHRFYCLSTEPWPHRMIELTASATSAEWDSILSFCRAPDSFIQWPRTGELLWPGCVRPLRDGEHEYPAALLRRLENAGVEPDTRTNGPAIAAFLASGGIRPPGWHVHHIYDGTERAPHAVRKGEWFTHSSGLVAVDPVVHDMAHQSRLLKWLLWREAYLRFGVDPAGVFSKG